MKSETDRPSTQQLAQNLKQKIQTDPKLNQKQQAELATLVDNIASSLNQFPDTKPASLAKIDKDANYNNYISAIFANISRNDALKPSKKRSLLYAVENLQQSLWKL